MHCRGNLSEENRSYCRDEKEQIFSLAEKGGVVFLIKRVYLDSYRLGGSGPQGRFKTSHEKRKKLQDLNGQGNHWQWRG
jgi:hypothetical protein